MKAVFSKSAMLLALFLFGFFLVKASPVQYATALESLTVYEKSALHSSDLSPVGLVGFYGQDQPRQWLVLTRNDRNHQLMTEFVVSDGQVKAQRDFKRLPNQDIPHIPFDREMIKIDSRKAFQIAESLAAKANTGFDSIHYQLRCRDLRNEPVWMLNLIDSRQVSVGVHYISAVNGDLLRSVWNPVQERKAPSTNPVGNAIKTVTDRAKGSIQSQRGVSQ